MEHWWTNYPWRVIQPNFREIDTKDFDEEAFLESLKEFSCNTVMINAAGLMASYPTELSDHVRSQYIDNYDLKHLVERCHENGIKVIARCDFSKIPFSVYEKHPDWAYMEDEGAPLVYNGYVQTCLLGGYQGGYMDEIIKEMFTMIPFDGIYCNMGTATGVIVDYSMKRHGPCQCERCQKAFKEKYGMDVPKEMSRTNKASMIYFRFQQEVAGAQKKRIISLVRELNPEIAYCSVDYVRQEANEEMGRELPHWQYQAASHARAIRGMGMGADVANVDFMGFFYRHVSVDPALQEYRLWQSLSNFGGLDYYVMGRLDNKEDQSAYDAVKKVFRYAKDHEDLCQGVRSKADVLLVRDSYVIPNPEERGFIRALTEMHILFDETLSGGLLQKDLSAYKAVILPEKPRLAPQAAEKLTTYALQGGMVIASGQVPALPMFGISKELRKNDEALGAMIRLKEAKRPLFMVGKTYFEREMADMAKKIGVYLEPERFGPPELCYATKEPTTFAGAYQMPFGEGCGVTIPWYPATNYYTDGFDNWFVFLEYLLKEVCHIPSIAKDLSPMVEITRGEKDGKGILHFINGSGHFGNSYFQPATLCDQTVTMAWPHESASCKNLDEEGNVTWSLHDQELTITIPKLGYHACIVIEEE